MIAFWPQCSNNTNKLNPQELDPIALFSQLDSNNTNKLSPQEHADLILLIKSGSNNTNKLSPQEPYPLLECAKPVQIIQINLVLKNLHVHTC